MNPTNENHEPTAVDDLSDRLVDRGLTEIVGRETVPNLSARILAATVPAPAATIEAPRTRSTRAFWAGLVVAATLLVGASIVLMQSRDSNRFLARKSESVEASANRLGELDGSDAVKIRTYSTSGVSESESAGKLMVGAAVNSDAALTGHVALKEQQYKAGAAAQRFRVEAAPGVDVNRYGTVVNQPSD